jgi:hypothetical protein
MGKRATEKSVKYGVENSVKYGVENSVKYGVKYSVKYGVKYSVERREKRREMPVAAWSDYYVSRWTINPSYAGLMPGGNSAASSA